MNNLFQDLTNTRAKPTSIQDCTIVGYEECRHIRVTKNEQGMATDSAPIEGSEKAVLDLRLPNGQRIKTDVSYADFIDRIVPLFPQPPT